MNQSRTTRSGTRSSADISMIITMAVGGWLIVCLLLAALLNDTVYIAHLEGEVSRYEQELKANAERTMEQKLKYTQYRRDL